MHIYHELMSSLINKQNSSNSHSYHFCYIFMFCSYCIWSCNMYPFSWDIEIDFCLKLQGVQFHPESIITPEGKKIVHNFVKLIERMEGGRS